MSNFNQKGSPRYRLGEAGFSPLVILVLVVLGTFIIWEMTLMFDQQFYTLTPNPSPKPANDNCNFPDKNDPCDLDSGTGFRL